MSIEVINIDSWISENEKSLQPPICNKLMHNSQLNVMFVGGPNIRKDYHIEEGEEFFYMVRGDMCLKILERGVFKDIPIKEGEVFLLPGRIPHSPQRLANTIGLVIERTRLETETDLLRFFVDGTPDPLYEAAFHCTDLGTELVTHINAFMDSKSSKTGIPDKENILPELPFQLDQTTATRPPVRLTDVAASTEKRSEVFPGRHQFEIIMLKEGEDDDHTGDLEQWIWQIEGSSRLVINDEETFLGKGGSVLLLPNTSYKWSRDTGCQALRVRQDGRKKC